ncbi:MAG: uracil-DNA glycosylase [Deltaproteobacteria bacterium]|nr:uracil-DNA glycosylase [Deltaproteobacteria bacterium]
MNLAEELKDVVGQIKGLLKADMEMGMDPPGLSPETLEYLDQKSGKPRTPHSLDDLKQSLADCRRCKLSRHRTHLVFGDGDPHARLVFVGHGPSDVEDRVGRPFTGEAGELLTRIIENGMGLSRDDVYICHVVKCRLPDSRDPEEDEIMACLPFLKQQIQMIHPAVICTLGQTAGQGLLGKEFSLASERGRWHYFMDIPVMPTYHPIHIIKDPARERELKALVWRDIQAVMVRLGLEVRRNG